MDERFDSRPTKLRASTVKKYYCSECFADFYNDPPESVVTEDAGKLYHRACFSK